MNKAADPPQTHPVYLWVDNLQILLIGAGKVAEEKLRSLLMHSPEANVLIVATDVSEKIKGLIEQYPGYLIQQRLFEDGDIENKDMVILATDDQALQQRVRKLVGEKRQLVAVNESRELNIFYANPHAQNGNGHAGINHKAIRINNEEFESGNRWKKIAMNCVLAFAFMLIGHFIFSYFPLHEIAGNAAAWYEVAGKEFTIVLVAGFVAQLVDGALGMGYGVTSATILLSAGVSPAAMSGSIHTAEMFASGASGYSHYKFGNVNKKMFRALVVPGVLGAIAGAVLLVIAGEKYGGYIKPLIAAYTLFLGIKFIITAFGERKKQNKFKRYRLLAAVGGFFDSFAGGGWGPIVTTTLINSGRNHKYGVGSVSLTEFFVTLGSAFTFFTMIGVSHWQTIVALIIGGLIASPIAARLAGRLPRKLSFILLGVLVIFWSLRILVKLL
jgi:uncharacterized membrane protein YfcA